MSTDHRRSVVQWLWTYAATLLFYTGIFMMAAQRIDPIRFAPPLPTDEAAIRFHGRPVFSGGYAAVWFLFTALYITAVFFPFRRIRAVPGSRVLLSTVLSVTTVALVHPLLIPVLLPAGWATSYVVALERTRLPLGAARIGFNVPVILTVVAFAQSLLVFLLLTRTRLAEAANKDVRAS